jgi:phage terminase small subunit
MTISKQGDKPNSTNSATGRKLTAKQQRFVEEYLIDLDATQAATRAGYSPKTAGQQGYQLLQKTSIKEMLAKLSKQRSDETGITAEWVLAEAARSYKINAKTKIDDDGAEVQINPAAAKAFLELVGKHVQVGAFSDKLEHSGPGGGPIQARMAIEFVTAPEYPDDEDA